jgi:hypothetical protein
VRRASALGMDETLPHFAIGKRANLLAPKWHSHPGCVAGGYLAYRIIVSNASTFRRLQRYV